MYQNNNYEKSKNSNKVWTVEESRLLAQYTAMGYTTEQIAMELQRGEPEVILHGISQGVLAVVPIEQKLPAPNPESSDDWNAFSPEPRSLDKVIRMADVFNDKVWFVRHLAMRYRIANGQDQCDPEVWERALKAADKIMFEQGPQNLGPYDDFEWGMVNGKLSALRWVLGCEWDDLDT